MQSKSSCLAYTSVLTRSWYEERVIGESRIEVRGGGRFAGMSWPYMLGMLVDAELVPGRAEPAYRDIPGQTDRQERAKKTRSDSLVTKVEGLVLMIVSTLKRRSS